jgi:hypothetical protein
MFLQQSDRCTGDYGVGAPNARGARIPEALWAPAGELARAHGVNQVSRALHLEFKHLKRVAESVGQNDGKKLSRHSSS